NAGHLGPVAGLHTVGVVGHRVTVVVDEVVTVDVVHVPVAVVVDAVPRDLVRVAPDVGDQVRVVVVHAAVEHGDEDVGRAGGDLPRLGGVDVGVRRVAPLAGVVEVPLPDIDGVGRRRRGGDVREDVVRLRVRHPWVAFQDADQLCGPRGRDGDELEPAGAGP